MKLLRLLLCLALSTLICECAFAVGKITVDPNAGGSTAPKAPSNIDARLAQKVTYEARYLPVQQILEDLTTMTGIELYAGSTKNDWPMRSRKMNIFVKDVKMADLMNSIAHVMKFKWTRDDDMNPPTYRLVVDRKAAAVADAQKARAEKQREELLYKKRKDWVDIIVRDGEMSPAQIDTIRDTDPILYRFAKPGGMRALHALLNELPEAKECVIAGKSFRISNNKLSRNTRDLLYSAGGDFQKFLQRGGGSEDPVGLSGALEPDSKFDIVFGRLDVDTFTPNIRFSNFSQGVVGWFYILDGTREFEIGNFRDRNLDWANALSTRESKIIDGQSTFFTPWPEMDTHLSKMEIDLKKEKELLYPSEPLNEHAAFPELEKTIKLIIDTPKTDQNPELAVTSYIAIIQKALADATGFGIVSDSWANIQGVRRMPGQEVKLSELLDKISEQYNYNWGKSSTILEFRHRMWWKNRLNQISDDLVAKWSENTRKNGVLSLDDLAEISTLTYDQAEESLKPDKVIGTAGIYGEIPWRLDTNLQWLRLYSALNSQQRAYLTERWISGAMLTPDQWKLAQTMFDRIGSLRSDALFSLRLTNDKELIYEFKEFEVTAQRNDDDSAKEDRKWTVALPKYKPPTSQKKDK